MLHAVKSIGFHVISQAHQNSFSQHVSMQADNTLGNEYAQIKRRYPLLRGILHIMTKDWLSSAILRGLPIVLVGGYFYLFYVIFLDVKRSHFH